MFYRFYGNTWRNMNKNGQNVDQKFRKMSYCVCLAYLEDDIIITYFSHTAERKVFMYEKEMQQLIAKEAIRDQIYTYCRALDRIDNELGYTIFSEDAEVDYGPTYKGSGRGFIDMMLKQHRGMISTHHMMTNILIKLNEDCTKAASETYMYAACKFRDFKNRKKAGFTVEARCRDIDNWELRDGKWVIVKRIVAGDNTFIVTPEYQPDYNNGRDKVKDPSYDVFASIE